MSRETFAELRALLDARHVNGEYRLPFHYQFVADGLVFTLVALQQLPGDGYSFLVRDEQGLEHENFNWWVHATDARMLANAILDYEARHRPSYLDQNSWLRQHYTRLEALVERIRNKEIKLVLTQADGQPLDKAEQKQLKADMFGQLKGVHDLLEEHREPELITMMADLMKAHTIMTHVAEKNELKGVPKILKSIHDRWMRYYFHVSVKMRPASEPIPTQD